MSNSIWHKYDIKDTPNPHHEILAWTGTKHAVVIIKQAEWRSGDCDWIISWAYIQDILAQADKAKRLQEIAEMQNDILQDHFAMLGYNIGKDVMDMSDEIKQLIKE